MTDFLVQHHTPTSSASSASENHSSQLAPRLDTKSLKINAGIAISAAIGSKTTFQSILDKIVDTVMSLVGKTTERLEVSRLITDLIQNIHTSGKLEAFADLHAKLRPELRSILQLDVTRDNDTWSYDIKLGGNTIHKSDTWLIGDGVELDKFETAALLSKTSDILGARDPSIDADIDLQSLATSLFGKDTWSKYNAVADFVLSKTPEDQCYSSPLSLQRLEEFSDDTHQKISYRLFVDNSPVHTSLLNTNSDQIPATACQIHIIAQTALRGSSDARSIDNFRAGNIQCMADDKETQQKITESLDDPICQAGNLVSIEDNADKPTFKATFRDGEREISFDFSTRAATNFELRSNRLKQALQDPGYSNLRDLTGRGHGTENDVILRYAMMPLKADIETAIDSITIDDITSDHLPKAESSPEDAAVSLLKLQSEVLQGIKDIKLENVTIGQLLYNAAPPATQTTENQPPPVNPETMIFAP